ncbi:hypothetical protein RFI_33338, partial [Reticulomyxa filosa]
DDDDDDDDDNAVANSWFNNGVGRNSSVDQTFQSNGNATGKTRTHSLDPKALQAMKQSANKNRDKAKNKNKDKDKDKDKHKDKNKRRRKGKSKGKTKGKSKNKDQNTSRKKDKSEHEKSKNTDKVVKNTRFADTIVIPKKQQTTKENEGEREHEHERENEFNKGMVHVCYADRNWSLQKLKEKLAELYHLDLQNLQVTLIPDTLKKEQFSKFKQVKTAKTVWEL